MKWCHRHREMVAALSCCFDEPFYCEILSMMVARKWIGVRAPLPFDVAGRRSAMVFGLFGCGGWWWQVVVVARGC